VNKPVAEKASELYVKLKKKGLLIQDADLLIAATALIHGLCVITNNVNHFSRIKGLKVLNWLE
jgi:predicted nucleic acid-binding protein